MAITRKVLPTTSTTAPVRKVKKVIKKVVKTPVDELDLELDDFDFDEVKPTVKPKQPKTPRTPKTENIDKDPTMKLNVPKKGLTRIFDALNAQLEVATVAQIVAAIKSAGSKSVNVEKEDKTPSPKTPKEPKAPKDSKVQATFERVTKEFGYRLKDGRTEPADLKEKFKANLERAKKDFPALRISMFNKVLTVKKQSGIVSGLRKTGGEWVFVCFDSSGKKFNTPVSAAL